MSKENVDLLLRAVAFANAGDVEAAVDLYHPDAELRDLQHPPDMPEVLRGRDAIVAALTRWLEVLDHWTIELHEYVDADPWVVGELTWHATGKGSNMPIDWRVAEAYEVKDGKIIRVLSGFPDTAAALKAVGLAEQAMSRENVEIVRAAFMASSGGDPAAAEGFYHPRAEWDMTGVAGWAEKDVYRGAEEILPFLQGWATSWQGWHFDVDEVREADTERAFVAIHEWATGVESDAAVDQRRYFAIHVDQGRIVSVRMFSERADALKAVGLEE